MNKLFFLVAVCFGILTVGMSFAADHVGGNNVFEIIFTVWGTIASPLFGVFTLSLTVPWSTGPVRILCCEIIVCAVGLLAQQTAKPGPTAVPLNYNSLNTLYLRFYVHRDVWCDYW